MSCTSPIYRIDLKKYSSQIPKSSYIKAVNDGVIFGRNEFDKFSRYLDPKFFQVLRCSSCIDCRLHYSHEWAVRCMLEAQYHEHNYFVTFTYDDIYLPKGNFIGFDGTVYDSSLRLTDFQKFLKRLRTKIDKPFRYFYCGEYGELTHRPHYHCLFFGLPELDLQFLKRSGGINYYRSSLLESAWSDPYTDIPLGFVTVCDFNYNTAAYTARYMMKKQKGKSVRDLKAAVLPDGFQALENCFAHQSRKPGLAYKFFEDNSSDIYRFDDLMYQKEYKVFHSKPPRYFDKLFDLEDPDLMNSIREKRSEAAIAAYDAKNLRFSEDPFARQDREGDMSARKERKRSVTL